MPAQFPSATSHAVCTQSSDGEDRLDSLVADAFALFEKQGGAASTGQQAPTDRVQREASEPAQVKARSGNLDLLLRSLHLFSFAFPVFCKEKRAKCAEKGLDYPSLGPPETPEAQKRTKVTQE